MSKNVINGVLVLMSISLLGVVGLQLYWINDAIQVKQAEFDRSVNEALARVVEKLETQEAANVVASQMASLQQDSITGPTAAQVGNPKSSNTSSSIQDKKTTAAKETQPKAPETYLANSTEKHKLTRSSAPVTTAKNSTRQVQTFGHGAGEPEKKVHLYFSKADSASIKQTLRKISGGKSTIITSTVKGNPRSYQRIVLSKPDSLSVAHLRKGGIYQLQPVQDSLNFIRLNNRPVRLSMDTLKSMAIKMDSIIQRSRQYQPMEIASIDIRNDSVFIITDSKSKPFIASRNLAPTHRGGKTQVRRHTNAQKRQYHTDTSQYNYVFKYDIPSKKPEVTLHAATQNATLPKVSKQKGKVSDISKIEVKKDKLNDVVQKMVVEYVVKDEPLNKRLNLQTLPDLIKTELENKGIRLDFGYWIVSGQNDTVAVKDLKALSKQDLPKYKASLFPNDIFEKQDYLGLYFPDSRTYAIKSLGGMLALSALFTLIIIATFGTTIHIIYRQKKLSEMKNDFINNMTHEFKTPIATISLATDAIANPKIYEYPEKIKHYTGIIRQENKRMNVQVENVLQIAQLEKNDFKLNFKPVDVHILINKAIESIRLQVEERLGQIHIQLDALQHELSSDEVHLFNVICNLLDNANKYSPATPDISLVTQNVEGGLIIAVEDKGMGMSKETQQRVFDKFYRVPTGNIHNVKGFGLGLSYVKAIVQAHRGNVRLKSELGKGSRFEIFLPLS